MEAKIILPESLLKSELLSQSLVSVFSEQTEIELKSGDETHYRGVDPTIVVAVVSAVGGAASAFIAGLLKCAQQVNSEKIIIQKGNKRIEITSNISDDELNRATHFFNSIDDEKIIIKFDE